MAQGLYGWLLAVPAGPGHVHILGVGRGSGEPVALFTPAAVLESSPCSGRPGPQRCEGVPGSSAPVVAKRSPVFPKFFACGQRIEETLIMMSC